MPPLLESKCDGDVWMQVAQRAKGRHNDLHQDVPAKTIWEP